MSPVTKLGAGHSEETFRKTDDFAHLVRMHARFCKSERIRVLSAGSPYLYADLTAGSGHLECDECRSCPEMIRLLWSGCDSLAVIACREIERVGLEYAGALFERHPAARAALRSRLNRFGRVTVYGENGEAPSVLAGVPAQTYGIICLDPNAVDARHWDLLRHLAGLPGLKRVDLMVHYAATNQKRVRRVHGRALLIEELETIDKNLWLVMEPRLQEQWTWLIGTNWTKNGGYPAWPQRKLYRADSPEGQAILERLTYTDNERNGKGETLCAS